jgi:hypothetical protein
MKRKAISTGQQVGAVVIILIIAVVAIGAYFYFNPPPPTPISKPTVKTASYLFASGPEPSECDGNWDGSCTYFYPQYQLSNASRPTNGSKISTYSEVIVYTALGTCQFTETISHFANNGISDVFGKKCLSSSVTYKNYNGSLYLSTTLMTSHPVVLLSAIHNTQAIITKYSTSGNRTTMVLDRSYDGDSNTVKVPYPNNFTIGDTVLISYTLSAHETIVQHGSAVVYNSTDSKTSNIVGIVILRTPAGQVETTVVTETTTTQCTEFIDGNEIINC